MIEARPLCAQLGLKAVSGHSYPVFQNGKTILVVSGTGALNASASAGWALGRFPEISMALNIGFAGASETVASMHEWRYIHSIRDEASGHMGIPDILWNHPFKESALLTVGKVLREDIGWKGLVDMEGSGFYQAARRSLAPDRIALLKWISDYLTGEIDVKITERKYANAIAEIGDFLNHLEEEASTCAVEEAQSPYFEMIQQRLRLSQTQLLFIEKWLAGYIARGGDWQLVEDLLPEEPPKHKSGNARIFEQLKNVLKG
ncbi:MAG: hypothetical protein AB3N63_08965 [Puniceicoccaceae bacterium]